MADRVTAADDHRAAMVPIARSLIAHQAAGAELHAARNAVFRQLHADGLNARQIAETVWAALDAAGLVQNLTPRQVRELGVGEWNVRRVLAGG